ncbi:SDR family oxidoreductase [Nocardia sp. alder85J]|uniref:SDR family oxidoreductase n=1 Tax=Nocardia sp. alder85J TaxID=2862949 RepID=UPI001CD6E4DA|nr:SDR family oxidoreductase [Nocardia sp. alder85J]MCX4097500.1 SDR family oxidoreductase [Nocardia sp. alder85J]
MSASDDSGTAQRPGRAVVVTGGTRGIGLAVARAFRSEGDRVTVLSRSGGPVSGDILSLTCDHNIPDQVEHAFAAAERQQGQTEVLVANAGRTDDGLMLGMDAEAFGALVDTNLTSTYRIVRRASTSMLRARRPGRIVLISSIIGFTGSRGQTGYAAAKAGLIGLARSAARELGPRGITVNVVAPGYVETDMTAELSEARRREVIAATPLGAFADPEDIAPAVVFLASAAARYVTGTVLAVDGGFGMGL